MSDADVLRAWELGRLASPTGRAVAMLSVANGADADDALLELTPGERDTRLFALRRGTFGDAMDCVVSCPVCGERLEFVLDAAELAPNSAEYAADTRPVVLAVAGYQATVRPPTLRALEQLAMRDGRTLLDECVQNVERDGAAVDEINLPNALLAAIDAHLVAADPAAITELAMQCPACAHTWSQLFDIVSYLWAEVGARADRLFSDVHRLARAYGWSEVAIIEMSPARRERYLGLVST